MVFIHMRMLQNPKAVREGGSGPGINTKQCLPSVPLCFVIISIEFQNGIRPRKDGLRCLKVYQTVRGV